VSLCCALMHVRAEGLPEGTGPVAVTARTAWYLERDDVEHSVNEFRNADAELLEVRPFSLSALTHASR
jgi:hypothetical protein